MGGGHGEEDTMGSPRWREDTMRRIQRGGHDEEDTTGRGHD